MPPRKKAETVNETPSAAPAAEQVAPVSPAAAPKADKNVTVAGTKHTYYHPFQKKNIPAGGTGVVVVLDSWLESQIKRGLIYEVKK